MASRETRSCSLPEDRFGPVSVTAGTWETGEAVEAPLVHRAGDHGNWRRSTDLAFDFLMNCPDSCGGGFRLFALDAE